MDMDAGRCCCCQFVDPRRGYSRTGAVPGDSDDDDDDIMEEVDTAPLKVGMERDDKHCASPPRVASHNTKEPRMKKELELPTLQPAKETRPQNELMSSPYRAIAPPPPSASRSKMDVDDAAMTALAEARLASAKRGYMPTPAQRRQQHVPLATPTTTNLVTPLSLNPPNSDPTRNVDDQWEVLAAEEESDGVGSGISYGIDKASRHARLGEGGHFNQVWRASSLLPTTDCRYEVIAVKCLLLGLPGQTAEDDVSKRKSALAEVAILKHMPPHPHIVGLKGVWDEPLRIRIGLELAGGGDIRDKVFALPIFVIGRQIILILCVSSCHLSFVYRLSAIPRGVLTRPLVYNIFIKRSKYVATLLFFMLADVYLTQLFPIPQSHFLYS